MQTEIDGNHFKCLVVHPSKPSILSRGTRMYVFSKENSLLEGLESINKKEKLTGKNTNKAAAVKLLVKEGNCQLRSTGQLLYA